MDLSRPGSDDVSMGQVLGIEGIGKCFGSGLFSKRRWVLQDVRFQLEPGMCLGLVGPNGSGKSTLLRCLAGIERPDAGRIELFGSHPADPRARARLGYLPEQTPFPAELSARSALELMASLHGWKREVCQRRVGEFLDQVGLTPDAQRELGSYSKGMQRRFGLAQAFLHQPELLLLDEPTAGLDAEGHLVLAELLGAARARGSSLLLTSHQWNDISEHCDALIVLVEGRIIARGTPLELLGSEGRVQLELEGLEASGLAKLQAEAERLGARVVSMGPSGGSFLELYRQVGVGRAV